MTLNKSITTTILLTILTGCSAQMSALREVGKPPPMTSVELQMEKDSYEPVAWAGEEEDKAPRYSNSLWQPGSRAFFKDMKARRIGDILKVTVQINDQAKLDNATKRSRTSDDTANASKIFGLEEKIVGLLPGVADASNLLDLAGTSNTDGTGNIARKETIETQVAAMVTQILPNGNLVVHGDQQIRVNYELRQVTVDGIVRQEDISADNSIESNQIAEARISYGGIGQLSNIQQPRIGTQIIDVLSPF